MEVPGLAVGPSDAIGKDLLRAGPHSCLAARPFPSCKAPLPVLAGGKLAEGAANFCMGL